MCTWGPLFRLSFCSWRFFSSRPIVVGHRKWVRDWKIKIPAFSTTQTLQATSLKWSHRGLQRRHRQMLPLRRWKDAPEWVEEAAGSICFWLQTPAWDWKQAESWERISHLGLKDGGCYEALGIFSGSFPSSNKLAYNAGSQSQLPIAKSQNCHVHLPEKLKDEALSRMALTLRFMLVRGKHSSWC